MAVQCLILSSGLKDYGHLLALSSYRKAPGGVEHAFCLTPTDEDSHSATIVVLCFAILCWGFALIGPPIGPLMPPPPLKRFAGCGCTTSRRVARHLARPPMKDVTRGGSCLEPDLWSARDPPPTPHPRPHPTRQIGADPCCAWDACTVPTGACETAPPTTTPTVDARRAVEDMQFRGRKICKSGHLQCAKKKQRTNLIQ